MSGIRKTSAGRLPAGQLPAGQLPAGRLPIIPDAPHTARAPVRRVGLARRLAAGTGYLAKGLRMWITSPRLMLLGAIPAFIVGVVYAAAVLLFAVNLDAIAAWATPFAEGWEPAGRTAVRFLVGAALVAGVVILAVVTFVAVTLTVGDPFYEKIWRAVESRLGDAPNDLDESVWTSTSRSIGNGLRLFAATASVGLLLVLVGFVPVVGQVGAPVIGALLGGWFLALELSGFTFDARGLRLRDRRRMLGSRRATTLGFGVSTYLLFLIPGAAIVVMPAAVAGATMLSRDAVEGATMLSRDAVEGATR